MPREEDPGAEIGAPLESSLSFMQMRADGFFDVAMHLAPFLENRRYLFRNSKIEMHLLKEKKHH